MLVTCIEARAICLGNSIRMLSVLTGAVSIRVSRWAQSWVLRKDRGVMIVKNSGVKKIFITTDWSVDPLGGSTIRDTTYYIGPGDKIDLDILGLKPVLKKKVKKKK